MKSGFITERKNRNKKPRSQKFLHLSYAYKIFTGTYNGIPSVLFFCSIQLCLVSNSKLISQHFRKDVYGIFTYPVTDAIAPGYSKIIKKPMDFLTMSKKIESSEYKSVDGFKVSSIMLVY